MKANENSDMKFSTAVNSKLFPGFLQLCKLNLVLT